MKISHRITVGLKRLSALLLLSGISAVSTVFALTVHDSHTVTMSVVIGGAPAEEPIVIIHTPLSGASPVTRMTIVQGEAGTDPTLVSGSSFAGRFKPGDASPALSEPRIRVTVFFRLLRPNLPSGVFDFDELPSVTGPDPTAFAFQINRSSVTPGQLQYKIRAEKLQAGTTHHVLATAWFPPGSSTATNAANIPVGIQAGAAQVIGPDGGRVVIRDGNPDDGQSNLNVPAGLFGTPATVTFDEFPADPALFPPLGQLQTPEAVYHVDTDQRFKGGMALSVLFPDFVFSEGGRDGRLDVSKQLVGTAGLFWWDGFAWRPLGGRVDPNSNLLTARVDRPGFYAVMSAPPISPEDRRPMEKVITPNGDGVNDQATFMLGSVLENVKIEIFDITGHRIRTINTSSNVFNWDGRDSSGSVVESGVYIYQYKLEGKRVSGLIAVAK